MSPYRVETRPETPTAGVTATVAMTELATITDRIPELVGWLDELGTHPDGLADATGELLRWAAAEGLAFDRHDTDAGDAWAGRFEFYLTDPAEQPDMVEWDTELAFKLAG